MEENGDTVRASGLCIELGNALWSVGKSGEAANFYQRAADLRSDFIGLEYVHAREKGILSFPSLRAYHVPRPSRD